MVTAVALAAVAAVLAVTDGLADVTYDAFRDMAWASNIVAGRVWSDPVLRGETWWYAPGGPLVLAAAARATGAAVVDVCRSSALWWNALIPVVLLLTVRSAGDRLTALLAVPLVWLGSLWWLTHLAAPMPSVQGVVPALASVLLWQRALAETGIRSRVVWSVATGLALAVTAWVHPVCAVHAAGAVGVQGLATAARSGAGPVGRGSNPLIALAVAAGTALVLALPVLSHLLALPSRNSVPMRYIARELSNPDFALALHAPLVLPLAVVGAVAVARTLPRLWWVLGWLGVAVVGQSLGYLHGLLGLRVPYLLPHEFQWHGQLALGVCAAAGSVWLGRHLARRLAWPREPWVAQLLWVGGATVAALVPTLPYVAVADVYLVNVRQVAASHHEVVEWLQAATPIDAVIACEPQTCHLVVAGLAGRKCVAPPIGHLNPSVDGAALLADLRTMLATGDEDEFLELARHHRVDYLLMDGDAPDGARRLNQRLHWRSLELLLEARQRPTLVFKIAQDQVAGGVP